MPRNLNQPDPNQSDPQPSERFARDLGEIYRADVPVPAGVDETILRHARASLARRRSTRMVLRIGALITAAAAMIVVAVHLLPPRPQNDVAKASAPVQQPTDIVDALKLARRIRANQIDLTRDDINHDGDVDQRDVDAIAMAVVHLPEAKVQ